MFVHPEGAREIRDGQRVFAVRREVVIDHDAAARAERQTVAMEALGARAFGRVVRRGRQRLRITERLSGDLLRGADVLIHERRRHLQGRRDVVEAVVRIVTGQQRRGVDRQIDQIEHRVRVLVTVQAMQADPSDMRMRAGGRVQRSLEITHERRDLRLLRLRLARRRHQTTAQTADRLLPDVGIIGERVERHRIERDATRPVGRVVALEAVFLDEPPVLLGTVGVHFVTGLSFCGGGGVRRGR